MEASTSSKVEPPPQQANVKCTLFVEALLSIEGLRQGHLCSSCSFGIGTHTRQSGGYLIEQAALFLIIIRKLNSHEWKARDERKPRN
jgi:hypothetical protein